MPTQVPSRLLLPLVIALAALFGWAVGDAHAQRPDLVVSKLSAVPNEVPVSGETTVTVSVRNLGSRSAPGYRVRFFFRESTVSRSTSNYRLTELNGGPISPGQVITSELAVTLPDSFGSNDYYLDEPAPASGEPPAWDPPTWDHPAGGLVYYVAPNGNDGSPGTETAPFRTLDKGVSVLTPGDTLYVKQGTYAESLNRSIPSGDSWSRPVRVAAYPGHTVILQAPPGSDYVVYFATGQQYISVEGFHLDGVNALYAVVKMDTTSEGQTPAHHIRLLQNEIMNAPVGHGVLVSGDGATYHEILYNKIHDNGNQPDEGSDNHGIYVHTDANLIKGNEIYGHHQGIGIQLFGGSQRYNVIRANRIHDNNEGILVNGDQNIVALNQLWNHGGGIEIGSGNGPISGNLVYHNTLYQNGAGILIRGLSANTVVRNNIVQQTVGAAWDGSIQNDGTGTVIDHNLIDYVIIRNNSPQPLGNNLQGDARFVNGAALDFHLRADSPARAAGLYLAEVPTDFDNQPWTSPRAMGVYQ